MNPVYIVITIGLVLLAAVRGLPTLRQRQAQSTSQPEASPSATLPAPGESSSTPESPSVTPKPTRAVITQAVHQDTRITIVQNNGQLQNGNTSLDIFVYPGASTQSSDTASKTLTSTADPSAITDWYKNKIKVLGMNTTSFVQTNTNDTVENKLAGAGNGYKVQVEIKREAGSGTTTIKISQ